MSTDWAAHRRALVNTPPKVEFHGTIPGRVGLLGAVPPVSGVYMFRDLRGPLYVGRTENIEARLRQHLTGSHNDDVNRVLKTPVGDLTISWVVVTEAQMDEIEKTLIRGFKPLCNNQLYS